MATTWGLSETSTALELERQAYNQRPPYHGRRATPRPNPLQINNLGMTEDTAVRSPTKPSIPAAFPYRTVRLSPHPIVIEWHAPSSIIALSTSQQSSGGNRPPLPTTGVIGILTAPRSSRDGSAQRDRRPPSTDEPHPVVHRGHICQGKRYRSVNFIAEVATATRSAVDGSRRITPPDLFASKFAR